MRHALTLEPLILGPAHRSGVGPATDRLAGTAGCAAAGAGTRPSPRLGTSALGEHGSAILFPEGGRGETDVPAPFKCGLYHLARRRPDLELVPVYLANLGRVLPRGAWLPAPIACAVTFGAPLRLEPGEAKTA